MTKYICSMSRFPARRAISRIDSCHPGASRSSRIRPSEKLGLSVCTTCGFPNSLPRARVEGRRVVGDARGVYGADRPCSIGSAPSGAGHRKPVLRGRAGADRHSYQRPARPTAIRSSLIMGSGVVTPGKGTGVITAEIDLAKEAETRTQLSGTGTTGSSGLPAVATVST